MQITQPSSCAEPYMHMHMHMHMYMHMRHLHGRIHADHAALVMCGALGLLQPRHVATAPVAA